MSKNNSNLTGRDRLKNNLLNLIWTIKQSKDEIYNKNKKQPTNKDF